MSSISSSTSPRGTTQPAVIGTPGRAFLDNGAQLVERLKNSVHGNTLPASLLLPVCLVLLL